MWKFNVYSSDLMAMITLCMRMSSTCVTCSKCDTIEGRELYHRKLPRKNYRSPHEIWTHDPPSFRSDAVGTGLLEVLRCYVLATQAYFVGRQKLFIYVHITVDNWGKLERIVTVTLGVSPGVDGGAKEGGRGWEGEKFSLLTSPPSLLQLLDSFEIQHGGYIWEQTFAHQRKTPVIQAIIWDRLLDRFREVYELPASRNSIATSNRSVGKTPEETSLSITFIECR